MNEKREIEMGSTIRTVFDSIGKIPDIARKTGVSQNRLYQIVNDRAYPSFDTLYRIKKAFPEVDMNRFFGDESYGKMGPVTAQVHQLEMKISAE